MDLGLLGRRLSGLGFFSVTSNGRPLFVDNNLKFILVETLMNGLA
jgi:hypothetical protein